MKLTDGVFTLSSGRVCVIGKRALAQKSIDALFAGKPTHVDYVIVPTRNKNKQVTRFVFHYAFGKMLPVFALVHDTDECWRFTSCVEGPRKVNLSHGLLGMDTNNIFGGYTYLPEQAKIAAQLLLGVTA